MDAQNNPVMQLCTQTLDSKWDMTISKIIHDMRILRAR